MPHEPWTLQPSPSASSLDSAGSTGRGVGAAAGERGGLRVGKDISNSNTSSKQLASMSSQHGSSTGNRLSSSNSDTLLSSSEDEATTNPETTAIAVDANVSELAVASNPHYLGGSVVSGVGSSSSAHTTVDSFAKSSPPSSQYRRHYYQQQQQPRQHQSQQRQHEYGYFDASGVETGAGVGTSSALGRSNSYSSGTKAAETIIHFPDAIPSLSLISFTSPPSSPADGPSSATFHQHNYPQQYHPSSNANHAGTAMSSSEPHHQHHSLPPPVQSTSSHVDFSEDNIEPGEQGGGGAFQSMRKRLSLRLAGATAAAVAAAGGGGGGDSDRIERRPSQSNNIHHKDPVRQYTKDSSKTLTSESTTGLLMREDLKDDLNLMHKGGPGAAGGGGEGVGFGSNRLYQQNRLTLGTLNFQESDYAGEKRRGSTTSTSSNITQTTYRLNINIPQTGYFPEKGGYNNEKLNPNNYNNRNSLNLSSLSPTTPKTPSGSIFGLAGSNNNNPAPNGKKYVDTRKRNKKRQKEEKQFAKDSFKKAKTLFSNERTFIHWIKFGMLLGALAVTLLNFSGDEVVRRGVDTVLANRVGRIGKNVGVTLMLICLMCLAYAAASYHWRHLGIVKDKGYERYFDRIGPTFITIALLATYTMNIVLTIQVTSLMDPNYEPSIYLNNNNFGQHGLPPLTTTPSPTTIPPPSISSSPPIEGLAPVPEIVSSPSPPPPPSMPQPQRPVFDTPYLPPGSTILIDSDEDDGSEFELSHSPNSGDIDDPAVSTASTKEDDTSSSPEAGDSSNTGSGPDSRTEEGSNASSETDRSTTSRSGNDGDSQKDDDDN